MNPRTDVEPAGRAPAKEGGTVREHNEADAASCIHRAAKAAARQRGPLGASGEQIRLARRRMGTAEQRP